MASGHVFATVGTTKFDLFISTLSCQKVLRERTAAFFRVTELVQVDAEVIEWKKVLQTRGYKTLTMQIGHGLFVPPSGLICSMQVEYFQFKDSIAEDIQRADLIISHAGAGSCLEALSAKKPLLVVINEDLMDNHQLELAQQLHEDGHVQYTTCTDLERTLQHMDCDTLKPFSPADPYNFTNFLDSIFGFENQK